MKQTSLAAVSRFKLEAKRTSKRTFLAEMNQMVLWAEFVAFIALHAPGGDKQRGQHAFAVAAVLCIRSMHQLNLAMQEALSDAPRLHEFVRFDLEAPRLSEGSAVSRSPNPLEYQDVAAKPPSRVNTRHNLYGDGYTLAAQIKWAGIPMARNGRVAKEPHAALDALGVRKEDPSVCATILWRRTRAPRAAQVRLVDVPLHDRARYRSCRDHVRFGPPLARSAQMGDAPYTVASARTQARDVYGFVRWKDSRRLRTAIRAACLLRACLCRGMVRPLTLVP